MKDEISDSIEAFEKSGIIESNDKIGHEQIYDLITGKEVSWQAIIYDLINTEQLNPWDIDIVLLANKYLEKVREMEEANFFVSGKVLHAASLLLRIKAEILLEQEIRSLDEILFGKKEDKKKPFEKIDIDCTELPKLYPKTPLPRMKKVSLQELMQALNKAISTENKRIKREVSRVMMEKAAEIVLPKTKVKISERIKKAYDKILKMLSGKSKINYQELTGNQKEEKISCFLPVLHLDTQRKIFLEQERHFDDIWIWLFKGYRNKVLFSEKESADKTYLADFFNLLEK